MVIFWSIWYFYFFCLISLPSVFYLALAKSLFAECRNDTLGKASRMNFELNFWSVSNDLGWRNSQHQSCRSQKVKKLCSSQLFYLNSFRILNMCLNFSNLKFKFCKRPRIKKTYNIKVVDLEKLWNFVVQKFFIWMRLGPQTSDLISN